MRENKSARKYKEEEDHFYLFLLKIFNLGYKGDLVMNSDMKLATNGTIAIGHLNKLRKRGGKYWEIKIQSNEKLALSYLKLTIDNQFLPFRLISHCFRRSVGRQN